ncbi:hypothetical protein M422DRAFT_260965 [Sphaerobolus stellatus SS14]|uniref:F-box domain-containing protein n=1 Tax=Sphaerobolus stellatus (strain SS14) TaxID=990650 RepID=A0A0C9V4H4_SPHS4|nr:hypothetical protein M422DRAFT_260965 [Sphaerobolus stellatus SS14]
MSTQLFKLTNLHVELQDAVLDMVDSPKDLLSFALTSKHFHGHIVPYHIQFRVIVCDLKCGKSLWKLLAERPLLYSRIRDLRLIEIYSWDADASHSFVLSDCPEVTYPKDPEITPGECVTNFKRIVPHLSSLTNFTWEPYKADILWNATASAVFPGLRAWPKLQEFQLILTDIELNLLYYKQVWNSVYILSYRSLSQRS